MRNRLRSIPVFASVEAAAFGEKEFPDNPLPLVAEWILPADAAGQLEPHAMSLCTGRPVEPGPDRQGHRRRVRVFRDPADSRKGPEIAENPHLSAHFYRPSVGRQVRIVGTAADRGRAASEGDIAERGRGSCLAAHLHRRGPLADRQDVLAEFERLGAAHPDEVPCPPSWTLYAITPTEVGFWQASIDRVHHRMGVPPGRGRTVHLAPRTALALTARGGGRGQADAGGVVTPRRRSRRPRESRRCR
ncbi:pyridoxamine 5'-phosphate oxidase family protein [Streptomyces sp. NBC_00378]|nr:pyridoxamine 5'-phosphate oxidase family protein [Streptomyces sp. NBC_00378]MCX5112546.1 pyridoxamine 5'-phosphate oxidase family protein [Streptomyces sp. NBC_00378]